MPLPITHRADLLMSYSARKSCGEHTANVADVFLRAVRTINALAAIPGYRAGLEVLIELHIQGLGRRQFVVWPLPECNTHKYVILTEAETAAAKIGALPTLTWGYLEAITAPMS